MEGRDLFDEIRANRPKEEGRYEDPKAKANEEFRKRSEGLIAQGLQVGGEANRINRRVVLNRFFDQLKAQYSRSVVQETRLYRLANNFAGGGAEWDLPGGEIMAFLERFAKGEES